MEDEQNYEAHLVPYETAVTLLGGGEQRVLRYAWEVYTLTLECQEYLAQQRLIHEQEQQQQETVEIPEIQSEDEDGAGSRSTDGQRSLRETHPLL